MDEVEEGGMFRMMELMKNICGRRECLSASMRLLSLLVQSLGFSNTTTLLFFHWDQPPFMLLDYCCRCCGFTLIKRHGAFSLKTTPSETWVVLQNLLMCMVCFYSLYYIAVSLCIGLFRVHEINSLMAPFDYTTQPSWQSPKYMEVVSTEVTYVLGGLVFAWIVEEWVWDYAITVTMLHVALTVVVMSDFPSAEHWWIALGSGLVMMILGGQLLAYKLFRNNFVYPAELQNF